MVTPYFSSFLAKVDIYLTSWKVSGIRYQAMAAKNKHPAKDLNNSVMSTPVKPSAKKGKANDDDVSDLAKIFELITQMNKKLDKLEHIEQHLTPIDEDIRDLKQSYTFVHNTTDELAKQQKVNSDALKDLSDKVANIEAQNTKLQQDLVDLRARSMWCNLLFYNLPESEQEDPFTIIREVLSEKMGIDENGDIEIERAHHLGRKREDGKPRAIVAKFFRYQDKEHIRKSAHLLKGTNIGIAEQFPKEIADARKVLYPVLKKAKKDGHRALLIKDKLFINGQRYRGTGRANVE